MFEVGNLLYFEPFIFPDRGNPKAKFFVVLADTGNGLLLGSLPTSKDHVPSDIPVIGGCLELPDRKVNAFAIMANQQITSSGFSFKENTFIYGANIQRYDAEVFLDQEAGGETIISVVGKLDTKLFNDIKDCLKNSDAVRKRFKQYL